MWYTPLVLGIIILFFVKYFEQKTKSKRIFVGFSAYMNNNLNISEQIIEKHSIPFELENIFPKNTDFYLVSKGDKEIEITPLNNNRERKISEKQYFKLINKFQEQEFTHNINVDNTSFYYRMKTPYDQSILWICFSASRIVNL